MPFEIPHEIPDELRDIVDLARQFARSELRDAENELDAMADPCDAFNSEVHRAITKQMCQIGFHKVGLAEEVGGAGLPRLARHLVEYELAVGGVGLAAQMLLTPLAAGLIIGFGHTNRHPVFREYVEAFMDDDQGVHQGAWTVTEPDAGSDIFTFGMPEVRWKVRARQNQGKTGWIIDGAKSAWCTNGYLADMLCVMVAVDPDAGMQGSGTFVIPADWPGITKGRPINKVGMRALNQAELSFDGVEIPNEFLIAPPGAAYEQMITAFTTPGNTSVGNLALGVAQAAYEMGLAYSKERVQGGVPIIEHQLVAAKLFDAYRNIEASKLLVRKSFQTIASGVFRPELAFGGRVQACETAAKVTQDMVFLHGGNGITKEYPIEKLWRDTRPLQIMDGTTDRVTVKAAALL